MRNELRDMQSGRCWQGRTQPRCCVHVAIYAASMGPPSGAAACWLEARSALGMGQQQGTSSVMAATA